MKRCEKAIQKCSREVEGIEGEEGMRAIRGSMEEAGTKEALAKYAQDNHLDIDGFAVTGGQAITTTSASSAQLAPDAPSNILQASEDQVAFWAVVKHMRKPPVYNSFTT